MVMPHRYAGVERVAVVGTGTIGASWAAFFLSRGLAVTATDPAPQAEDFLRRFVDDAWDSLRHLGMVAEDGRDGLRFCTDLDAAIDGADLVQESGPEREDFKIELFERMDALLPRETIIASSSSFLLMSRLQSRCRFPERCVLGHPFNPPHLIPLIEVVGGEATAPATVDRAIDFYRAIGKRPIRLNREIPGHVANRLQSALGAEATALVAAGIVSVADADTAVTHGPGLRWAMMGPFMTQHLGGGAGGIEYFMANIARVRDGDTIGSTVMTAELRARIIAGVKETAGGQSIAELTQERDRKLLALFAALGIDQAPIGD
jgi:3-hydroxyacyl-CoA dehydrogenase